MNRERVREIQAAVQAQKAWLVASPTRWAAGEDRVSVDVLDQLLTALLEEDDAR